MAVILLMLALPLAPSATADGETVGSVSPPYDGDSVSSTCTRPRPDCSASATASAATGELHADASVSGVAGPFMADVLAHATGRLRASFELTEEVRVVRFDIRYAVVDVARTSSGNTRGWSTLDVAVGHADQCQVCATGSVFLDRPGEFTLPFHVRAASDWFDPNAGLRPGTMHIDLALVSFARVDMASGVCLPFHVLHVHVCASPPGMGSADASASLVVRGVDVFVERFPILPAAPTWESFGGDAGGATVLGWRERADGRSPILEYRLYRDGQLLATLPATSFSFVDDDITSLRPMCYQVSAVNAVGEGPRSAPACVTPRLPSEPGTVRSYDPPFDWSEAFTGCATAGRPTPAPCGGDATAEAGAATASAEAHWGPAPAPVLADSRGTASGVLFSSFAIGGPVQRLRFTFDVLVESAFAHAENGSGAVVLRSQALGAAAPQVLVSTEPGGVPSRTGEAVRNVLEVDVPSHFQPGWSVPFSVRVEAEALAGGPGLSSAAAGADVRVERVLVEVLA